MDELENELEKMLRKLVEQNMSTAERVQILYRMLNKLKKLITLASEAHWNK